MNEIIDVSVAKIRIKRRVRREVGDLVPLMQSLRKHGQFTPIILNESYELIAGFRRLESAKRLGWASVKAVILERDSELEMLEMELEENIQRKDLSDVKDEDALLLYLCDCNLSSDIMRFGL